MCVLGDKNCWFFGKLCVSTKWIIRSQKSQNYQLFVPATLLKSRVSHEIFNKPTSPFFRNLSRKTFYSSNFPSYSSVNEFQSSTNRFSEITTILDIVFQIFHNIPFWDEKCKGTFIKVVLDYKNNTPVRKTWSL